MIGTLGCGEYEVHVRTRGGAELVAVMPWTSLTWERVLDDTSAASVVADTDCCDLLSEIRSWQHEIGIYRDGVLVWAGPVFDPTAPAQAFQVEARDLSAWWDHRLIHSDYNFASPTDLATIFEVFSDDAMAPDNSPGLYVTTTPCGVDGVRQVLALQHQMAGQQLRDLARIGVDWTVVGRDVLAGGLVIPTEPIGTLTDEHFVSRPTVNRDGSEKANLWVVRGSGGTDLGDAIYGTAEDTTAATLDGLLESVATDSTILDSDSATAGAQSRVEITADILLVENAILAPSAPVTVSELVPGSLCDLRLGDPCYPASGRFRLQKVEGTAQASDGSEAITIVFQPPGTE